MSKRVCRPETAYQRQAIPWFEFLRVARLTSISREGAVVPRQRCPRPPAYRREPRTCPQCSARLPVAPPSSMGRNPRADGIPARKAYAEGRCERGHVGHAEWPHWRLLLNHDLKKRWSDSEIPEPSAHPQDLEIPLPESLAQPPRRGFRLPLCQLPGNLPGAMVKTFK